MQAFGLPQATIFALCNEEPQPKATALIDIDRLFCCTFVTEEHSIFRNDSNVYLSKEFTDGIACSEETLVVLYA
jgi:hypothetical protein